MTQNNSSCDACFIHLFIIHQSPCERSDKIALMDRSSASTATFTSFMVMHIGGFIRRICRINKIDQETFADVPASTNYSIFALKVLPQIVYQVSCYVFA